MTLNELRYIVAVSQERNFRRAAERVFVSQPALSLAIQKLEEELGVQIFERSRTAVSMTPIGELIVAQAQRALEEAAQVKEIASQGKDQLAGTLRLGAIYTVGPYLLPELIPVLKRKAPHMPLEMEENQTANLEALLANGRLDVIIIALPFGGPGIATQPLYDEDFSVVVPLEHSWVKKKQIKTAELVTEKILLLNSGHCFSNQVREACAEFNSAVGEIQQGNSLETIRNMVASGLGITVLPVSANSDKYRSQLTREIPFAPPAPARRIALAWRKSFARKEAIEVLAQAIVETQLAGTRPVKIMPAK
ncbi:MAG TPA: hydrogen peroxide-inducible genes activator [Gallionellaceae bacterium]|nr:hydrogen peroxide-inducible genes activator [Gallionellaceae bacterium]